MQRIIPSSRRTDVVVAKAQAKVEAHELRVATEGGVPFSLDSEFDPDDTLVSFSYSWGRGVRKVVDAKFLPYFAEIFSSPKSRVVYSNFKADAKTFRKLGVDLRPSFHADVVSLEWFVDENIKRHGLKAQVKRWLGRSRLEFEKLFSYVPPGKKKALPLDASQLWGLSPLPEEALLVRSAAEWRKIFEEYGGDDAEDTILLYWKHRPVLEQRGYWPTYLREDRQYTHTLENCHERGILIDQEGMHRIRDKALVSKARAERSFKAAVGRPDINLNAKDQLRDLLVGELEWEEHEDLRTEKTGQQQITKLALSRWAKDYELAEGLLRRGVYDKLAKDITSLLAGVSPDGRLRSDFNQHGTISGRCSSRKWKERVRVEKWNRKKTLCTVVYKKVAKGANLQNVVSPGAKDPFGVKDCFVAPAKGQVRADGSIAEEDCDLVVVDFSGFELVLAVYLLAKYLPKVESRLVETMRKYGSPSACHALTAILAFDLPVSMDEWKRVKTEHPDEYRVAKEMNFGLLYGGTWYTLANRRRQDVRDPKVEEENRALVDRFFDEMYPELVKLQRVLIKFGYEHGYTLTISGRRQHVAAGLASWNKGEREHWERKCVNGPDQGSAADIVKVAMNLVEKDEQLKAWKCFQLFQVHDELVLEAPRSVAPQCLKRVEEIMVVPFRNQLCGVKLSVEGKHARTWRLAK